MSLSQKVVLFSAPEVHACEEVLMRFRLTYEGPLRATQRDPVGNQANPLAVYKQHIRREFHRQLKELWRTNKFLSEHKVYPRSFPVDHRASDGFRIAPNPEDLVPLVDCIAAQYHEFGYRFVPLVLESLSLLCSLNILFLRRDIPGSVIQAGDIDNRIKTVIDALRRPRNQMELISDDAAPNPDEDPFFCLLEDDSQVSHLVVETDTLLDPLTNDDADHQKVKLIITVELRPYDVTTLNLSYV